MVSTMKVMLLTGVLALSGCCKDKELPACDAAEAQNTAKQAIENAPTIKARGIKVTAIGTPGEVRFDKQKDKRVCRSTLTTQLGTEVLFYSVEWQDKKKGIIWVQVMGNTDTGQ